MCGDPPESLGTPPCQRRISLLDMVCTVLGIRVVIVVAVVVIVVVGGGGGGGGGMTMLLRFRIRH